MAGRPSAVTICKRWASSIFQLRPFHLAGHGIAERRTLTADALLSAVKARSWPFCSNAMLLTPRLKNPGIVLTGDGEVETIHSSHPETAQPYDNPTLIACYTALLSDEWHLCCSISALRAPSALHLSALASLSPFVPPGLSGIELRLTCLCACPLSNFGWLIPALVSAQQFIQEPREHQPLQAATVREVGERHWLSGVPGRQVDSACGAAERSPEGQQEGLCCQARSSGHPRATEEPAPVPLPR